ncbi:MAG: 16S rRNA (cytidine(1402)-2'-O)-methyltransferase [Pseudomonadota bacterium]
MSGEYQIGARGFLAPPQAPGLYIVATPIGNLRDITIRALETIAGCDILACEDTRMTRRLLDRYAINQKLIAYHEHNADKAGAEIMMALDAGKSVALVSDAGTPLISDPGYRLVHEARGAGYDVFAVPGPSALIAALSVSGLPTDDFRFCGFLPTKVKARADRLTSLLNATSTLIFYESPARLTKTLSTIVETMGSARAVVVARELTKRFETIVSGTAADVATHFEADPPKGEIVILIEPAEPTLVEYSQEELDNLLVGLAKQMPASKAAKTASEQTGLPKSGLYQRLVEMKDVDG